MSYRPLGQIKNIVEQMGIDISHAHEDLIFVDHTAFILRFDDQCDTKLFVHFNTECQADDAKLLMDELSKTAKQEGFTTQRGKDLRLVQIEGKEEIRLEFV